MKFILFSLIALFLFANNIHAQVVINEYSCSNWSLTTDDYGNYEDWVELYNNSPAVVNIGGYYLSDKPAQPKKWRFPPNTIINGNSYQIVWLSGRNQSLGGNYHTNFKLTQTKLPTESIVLADSSGTITDQVMLTATQNHHSYGRIPDGGANWNIYTTPSPGNANITASAKQRYAMRPSFNRIAGFYGAMFNVTITTSETNATIHYTTDGSTPTSASTMYTTPVTIDSTTVLKAITIASTSTVYPSFINFATYIVQDLPTLPVVSISSDSLIDLANGNGSLKPKGTIEYFGMNRLRKTAGYGEFNRHGQDSWANDQRSIDFIMRDEFGYSYALQEQLFSQTPRNEFQRVILRAAGDDNYPAAHHSSNAGSAHLRDAYVQNLSKSGGLSLDVRIGTKCIVYINGKYWGVYDIRENPDDQDYTDYYYHQSKYNIQYIETWGSTWAQYGGAQALSDWDLFRTYVLTSDMNDPVVWDNVTSTLDVASLADYVIVNSLTVCSDWLIYNTGWWRGLDSTGQHKKWGYILWDNDAVFGFYANYTGIPDKGPNAAPCNVESGLNDPENHIDILNKLRTNPTFNNYYISRYIDLSNTTFGCDYMLSQLDSITAVIDPEMTRHALRWFGTYTEWKNNVQTLRDYIQQRCNILPSLMDSCYNLTGPYPLTMTADPIGTGKVKLNSLTISDFPWSGNYHGGIPVYLTAYADTLNAFTFERWETLHNSVIPNVYAQNAELNLTGSDTVIAHFLQHTVNIPEINNNGFDAMVSPSVFRGETKIAFYLAKSSQLSIVLYSTIGQEVFSVANGNFLSGNNQLTLNLTGKGIPAGIYLMNFKSENINKTIRVIYNGQ